jgi:hypothetical protein
VIGRNLVYSPNIALVELKMSWAGHVAHMELRNTKFSLGKGSEDLDINGKIIIQYSILFCYCCTAFCWALAAFSVS